MDFFIIEIEIEIEIPECQLRLTGPNALLDMRFIGYNPGTLFLRSAIDFEYDLDHDFEKFLFVQKV